MKVIPKLTCTQLSEGKDTLEDGREFFQSLPAVISDAKLASQADSKDPKSPFHDYASFDPTGYAANLQLAKEICAAFRKLKKIDKDGSHFVLAWRLYPNKNHPRWQDADHTCGCGFGGDCCDDQK